MTVAILPGTFDPVTVGHLDLIERAAKCCQSLIVAVGNNRQKNALFTAQERASMLEKSVVASNVKVVIFDGLLVDAAQRVGATFIIKGVRDATDLAYEQTQAAYNRELAGMETLLIPSSAQYGHVSSTMVRELVAWGVSAHQYVPPAVWEEWTKRELPERQVSVGEIGLDAKSER